MTDSQDSCRSGLDTTAVSQAWVLSGPGDQKTNLCVKN